mmetsp:Transcript_94024/g.287673  ORF Transcript_94024/g.287673 Transcript_94024/m.287673 type:complete len:302 (-) Transcript_94024:49-954(-)
MRIVDQHAFLPLHLLALLLLGQGLDLCLGLQHFVLESLADVLVLQAARHVLGGPGEEAGVPRHVRAQLGAAGPQPRVVRAQRRVQGRGGGQRRGVAADGPGGDGLHWILDWNALDIGEQLIHARRMFLLLLSKERLHFLAHGHILGLPVLIDGLALDEREVLNLRAANSFCLVRGALGLFVAADLLFVLLRQFAVGVPSVLLPCLFARNGHLIVHDQFVELLPRGLALQGAALPLLGDELPVLFEQRAGGVRRAGGPGRAHRLLMELLLQLALHVLYTEVRKIGARIVADHAGSERGGDLA